MLFFDFEISFLMFVCRVLVFMVLLFLMLSSWLIWVKFEMFGWLCLVLLVLWWVVFRDLFRLFIVVVVFLKLFCRM